MVALLPYVKEGNPRRSLRETLPFGEPTLVDLAALEGTTRVLFVMGQSHSFSAPLAAGVLSLGRSPECAVVMDEGSVSRRHAILHVGDTVELEDLGSANGSFVEGVRLAPGTRALIAPGRVFELGSVALVVQTRSRAPRSTSSREDFVAEVDRAIARAAGKPGPYVVRFRAGLGAAEGVLQRALAELDAGLPVFAAGPGDYLLLVEAGASLAEVRAAAERVRLRAEAKGLPCSTGVSRFPEDGRDAATLELTSGLSALKAGSVREAFQYGALAEMRPMIERLGRGNLSVLVLGETGTGKELLAETLHRFSSRAGRPFVRLNCGALSETLLESELFGHERGAFTGAAGLKRGLLESATGGSVFLDEVGELPAPAQVKLLRALEDRKVRRVGAVADLAIDVRFIAATNRDLQAEVAAGTFRQDLYFRLAGATLRLPPLRERKCEIRPLVQTFLERSSLELGRVQPPSVAPAAMERLLQHGWPGNVRELRNVVERAVLLCVGDVVDVEHLPDDFTQAPPPPRAPAPTATESPERERILEALSECGGNQTRAARLLGMGRRTLVRRLAELGIPRPKR